MLSNKNDYDNFEHLKLSIEKPRGQLLCYVQYATAITWHKSHPLYLPSCNRPAVLSRRYPWPPVLSPKTGTFTSTAAKFLQPWPAWPLAAYPVWSDGRLSWLGKRPMGAVHFSDTLWSLRQSATVSRSLPWNLVASVEYWMSLSPPGPAPPESCLSTSVTVSLVILTRKSSGGQSGYESRLAAVGGRASGCLVCSTSITLSPVLVHRSAGWITPPVSWSAIHCTVVRSFPWSTRIWKVLALRSSVSSLWVVVRYFEHVRRVYSTNIPWRPASQASSSFSIHRRNAWDVVTCRLEYQVR